jgi:uncharacterized OB-fold protein
MGPSDVEVETRLGDRWQVGFWAAAERGEVAVQRCGEGHYQFPGGPACARCGREVKWIPVSGLGTVWSWAEFHHRYFERFLDPPYVVMIVELDQGVRTYSAPDPENPWQPWIGARVRMVVGEYGGRRVPVARLIDEAEESK